MEQSVLLLKNNIQILRLMLQTNNSSNIFRFKPKSYRHKIENFREKFSHYHESTILKSELSKLYNIVGRFKFYGDNMLYIYLEAEEKEFKDDMNKGAGSVWSSALLWPFMCHWRVEMWDETERNNRKLLLGESTCIFNRPRGGLKSHSNDWISIDLGTIEGSGLIAHDGSVALEWTVRIEPFLNDVSVEDFLEVLEKFEKCCDNVLPPEAMMNSIRCAKDSADAILKKRRDNKQKLKVLKEEAFQMSSRLKHIENDQAECRRFFKTFRNDHIVPLLSKLKVSS